MSDRKPGKNTFATRTAEKYPTSKDVQGKFHSQLSIARDASRCPNCRALVVMPCLECKIEEMKRANRNL